MGLFNIFKKKKSDEELFFEEIHKKMFPNGEKDITAGTAEFISIFGNSISAKEAEQIFLKSLFLFSTAENYTEEMLHSYLTRETNLSFNKKQLSVFYGYLTTLKTARALHNTGPSEIRRDKNGYVW